MTLVREIVLGSIFIFGAAVAFAEPIPRVDTSIGGFVGTALDGPLDAPTLVGSVAEFDAVFGSGTEGLSNPFLPPSVAGYFANGGTQLYVVRVEADDDGSMIGVDGGPGGRTGLQALLDVDEVSVVAIPGVTSLEVQEAMIAHCESAADRMAVLDPASLDDIDAVLAQRAALSSTNGHAALYFPWVVAEPAGSSQLLPPSGLVAGLYARTLPPDSPVGTLATATGVSLVLNSQQSDVLNQAGISSIRLFSGPEVRVWGARTISSDPEWRYVSVRRTAFFLQESISDGIQWALFEPNDETLWAILRQCVEDFLFALWQEGWFQGSTPESAFFVRVDETTMTQQDIDEGRTILHVGFAPLQPSEFLVLRIVLQRESGTSAPVASFGSLDPRVVPNPFDAMATIEFDLPQGSFARLGIYDTGGRLVRSLIRGEILGPGNQARVWDGRDDDDARVPTGVYFSRLVTPSTERVVRMLLVE